MYEKSLVMTILKTRHIIAFNQGEQAIDILQSLKLVPSTAKLTEFSEKYDGKEQIHDYILTFELEEKLEKEDKK